MKANEAIEILEAAWSEPDGVLFRLRQGNPDREGMEKLHRQLRQIEVVGQADCLPRRLVSLLWYLPLFIGWQKERAIKNGANSDDIDKFATKFTNELERILGVP
jgi:hypothetical protein